MSKRARAFALFCLALPIVSQAAGKTDFIAEIPFTDCRGLICLQLGLDDAAPRTLMLDTGNVKSALMQDVAQRLGWTLQPYERNGKVLPGVQRAGTHRVRLGAQAGADTEFLAFDRAQFGDDPPPIDGTLAYPFFKDRVLEIDYPHRRVRISAVIDAPGATTQLPGKLQLITFGKAGPPILVGAPFTVDGKAVHAQIDTGFSGSLLVYDQAIDALGLRALVDKGAPKFFPDTDGGVTLNGAPIAALGFDTRALATRGATVYFPGASKNPVHQPDGLFEATVGNALFVHSVVTLDFHAMTLDVRPI